MQSSKQIFVPLFVTINHVIRLRAASSLIDIGIATTTVKRRPPVTIMQDVFPSLATALNTKHRFSTHSTLRR